MPIQFCCTQCGQPIEVDSEHAGQTAGCPYCRHMVSVPIESTYRPEMAVAARPAAPSEDAPSVGVAVPGTAVPITPLRAGRMRAAAAWGSYSLISTALILVLFGVAMIRVLTVFAKSGFARATSAPSSEQVLKMQQQVAMDPWITGSQIGALFFAVVALALGIVSLNLSRQGNWRGVVGVVISGLFLLCICGGTVIAQLAGFGVSVGG